MEKKIKEIRKAIKDTGSKSHIYKKQVRQSIKYYGRKETYRKLQRQLRYYQGYAYRHNVEVFILRLQSMGESVFDKLISYLKGHINTIMENDLSKGIEILYDFEHMLKMGETYSFALELTANKLYNLWNIKR